MKLAKLVFSALFLAGLSLGAQAQECAVTVDSTDQMRYDTDRIVMDSSCDEFTVTLTHSGEMAENVMGHNWVLSLASDLEGIAQDGMSAGLENEYLKPGDERVIAATDVIGGGEETSVTFDVSGLDPDADYKFFCSFAGHSAIMQGEFVIE